MHNMPNKGLVTNTVILYLDCSVIIRGAWVTNLISCSRLCSFNNSLMNQIIKVSDY